MKKTALTGIKPSGQVHFGNYLGMIRPALSLQNQYNCIYFIADLHALTSFKEAKLVKEYTLDLVATWVALGLKHEEHILYAQSDVPEVCELSWYLSCFTGFGFLERAHAFKDAHNKNQEINVATFNYPILMAADILLYDADLVPVGKDQKQHIEMARDMASSFNHMVKSEVLKLPEPLISKDVMLIPGTDGNKMSKSYNNIIPLFCSTKELRKKILAITTDSSSLEETKDLDNSLVGIWFKLFATSEQYRDLKQSLSKGGIGWGHAKQALFEVIDQQITPLREAYLELRKDTDKLESILKAGKEKAQAKAKPILDKVRSHLGF